MVVSQGSRRISCPICGRVITKAERTSVRMAPISLAEPVGASAVAEDGAVLAYDQPRGTLPMVEGDRRYLFACEGPRNAPHARKLWALPARQVSAALDAARAERRRLVLPLDQARPYPLG